MAGVQITARDRALLSFAAEHRIVLADHVRALLEISWDATEARLRALARGRILIRRRVFHGHPFVHWITRHGLAAIGCELPLPRLDVRGYEHDIGVAWLWLAARDGLFGSAQAVIGERRLRSVDGARDRGQPPLAVRLGGVGPRGLERLHYPDLLVVDRAGRRLALELELSDKGRRRRERILAAYGADPRIEAVVYLVTRKSLGRSIAASADRLGVGPRVYVQLVRSTIEAPSAGDGAVAAVRVAGAVAPARAGAGAMAPAPAAGAPWHSRAVERS